MNACPVRISASTVFRSLREQRIHSSSVIRELLPNQCRAHIVIAKDGAVVAFGGFVQFDGVVLDSRGLELLGDALLHVARCLPNL